MQICQQHFQNNQGASAQYVNVQVFNIGTNTAATIYNALTNVAMSSVIQTDVNGNIMFTAADGKYEIRSVVAGQAITAYVTLYDPTGDVGGINLYALGSVSGATDVDLTQGDFITCDCGGVATVFNLLPPAFTEFSIVMEIENGIGGVTFAQTVNWANETAPAFSAEKDTIVLYSLDSGTSYAGVMSIAEHL